MASASRFRVLLGVVQSAAAPGPRYRVLQYIPSFEAAGFECTVWSAQSVKSTRRSIRSAQSSSAARLLHRAMTLIEVSRFLRRVSRSAADFDRVLLYRIPVPARAVPALERWRRHIVCDFDDALDAAELETVGLIGRLRQRTLRRGFENLIRVSRVAITSNERNADAVRAAGGTPVVVPTSVDTVRLRFRDRRTLAGPRPVLGWMGTPSTARYLTAIEGPLAEIARRHSAVVRLVGAGTNPFTSVAADVRPWQYETEADDVAAFDVGLMPMPDTAWTRGKAALKALQYGATGAPTVASWTPTNAEILGDDEGAILCRSDEQWTAALDDLITNAEWRSELGRRGRQLVCDRYSVAVNAPRIIEVVKA